MRVELEDLPPAIIIGNRIFFRQGEVIHSRDAWFARASGGTVQPYLAKPDETLIDISDAAEILHIHPKTLTRYLRQIKAGRMA
jgi:hypothetical protein